MPKTIKASTMTPKDPLLCPRDNNTMVFNPSTGKWHCSSSYCRMTARHADTEIPANEPPRIVGVASPTFVPKKRDTRIFVGGRDIEFYAVENVNGVQGKPVDITDCIDTATFENDGTVVVILNIPRSALE